MRKEKTMYDELKGLDIKIDRYHIKSDTMCMWIETEVETKKTKNTKNDTKTMVISGYHRTLSQLMRSFVDYSSRHMEAKKTAEALKKMSAIREDAVKIVTAISEEIDEKLRRKKK